MLYSSSIRCHRPRFIQSSLSSVVFRSLLSLLPRLLNLAPILLLLFPTNSRFRSLAFAVTFISKFFVFIFPNRRCRLPRTLSNSRSCSDWGLIAHRVSSVSLSSKIKILQSYNGATSFLETQCERPKRHTKPPWWPAALTQQNTRWGLRIHGNLVSRSCQAPGSLFSEGKKNWIYWLTLMVVGMGTIQAGATTFEQRADKCQRVAHVYLDKQDGSVGRLRLYGDLVSRSCQARGFPFFAEGIKI